MKRQITSSTHRVQKSSTTQEKKTPASPTDTVRNGDSTRHQELWDKLPHELAQKIVWYRAPLPGHGRPCAQDTRIELLHTLMINRKLRRAAQPFMRLARWSHEFAKCWPMQWGPPLTATAAPHFETLISDPMLDGSGRSTDLSIVLLDEPRGPDRTNLLLSPLNDYRQSPFLAPLLSCLFDTWVERRQNASAHALRLPLDYLPQRLLHADPLLTPPHVYAIINVDSSRLSLHTADSAPVELLMRHFLHFDKSFQRTLALHLLLLLEDEDLQLAPPTLDALKRHGIADHDMVQQAMRWKAGLLDTPPDRIDVQLVREVLEVLKQTHPLSGMAHLALLSRLCSVPRLRALESDEAWIGLIQRAMEEIRYQLPAVWTDVHRMEYLAASLPEDLGLKAFSQMPAAQRLRFIRKPYCNLYFKTRIHMPYLRALIKGEDVEPKERLATLDHFIRGVEAYGAYEASALPQLKHWRQTLADAIANQAPAKPDPRHVPV